MIDVRVFHTHIEVYPYTKGDCPEIEYMLSKYDNTRHTRIPMGYYIEDDILYLPRGINISLLEKFFNTMPIPITRYDPFDRIKSGDVLLEPKSRMQENGIKFLCGEDDYSYSLRYSQLGLNLDTGDGKTYACISAILKLKMKTLIITHQEKIKTQWIESFDSKTTFPMERICNISNSKIIDEILNDKIEKDIYFVNHQTLRSYARTHGWTSIRKFFKKIRIGLKVIDESHKFFESTFMIDNFSNCYKTFYLTATFGRSDPGELSIYKKAFSSLVRFGEETLMYTEKRRHIHFIVTYFQSKPEYGNIPNVKNNYGFSSYKYIDYEMNDTNKTLIKVLRQILDKTSQLEGRTLILSPKKETVDYIAKEVEDYTGIEVGTIYSGNTEKQNEENKMKKIISSTVKSVGTGSDIDKLRILINLEPVCSKDLADQIRGRLREYSKEDDTYLFYPVDMAIPEMYSMVKRILPVMKKKCKEISFMKINV